MRTDMLSGPGVVLVNPKYPHSVGGIVRACSVWGIRNLLWTGDRVDPTKMDRLPREERMKAYGDVTWRHVDTRKPFDHFSHDVVPIAVEFRDNAENLMDFVHPTNAVYVFGPEDGGLNAGIMSYCHRFLMMPTKECLNLSAAVNVVMYDRKRKEER